MSIKIDVLEKGENMQLKLCLKSLFDMKALGYIISGSLLYSIGFNVFILPCDLYNGGFLGISQFTIVIYFFKAFWWRFYHQNYFLCNML